MHPQTPLNLVATAAAVTTAAALTVSATADVTVLERESNQQHTVTAGCGSDVDTYSDMIETTDPAATFDVTQEYAAFMVCDGTQFFGEGAAYGLISQSEQLIFSGGSLAQIIASGVVDLDVSDVIGDALGQVSSSGSFSVFFEVTEPIDLVLEGEMFPSPGDLAQVRLQRSGTLFPMFHISSLFGDSGPYSYTTTLTPGTYTLRTSLFGYNLHNFLSDPPFIEGGSYTMTATFGDGPPACPADLDGSQSVDFSDVVALLAAWGPCPGCPADLDGDGTVGFADLVSVLGAWGECTP